MRTHPASRSRLPGAAGAALLLVVGLATGGLLGRLSGDSGDDGSVRTFRAEVKNVTESGTMCVAEEGTGRRQGCGVPRLAQGQSLPAPGDVVVVQEVETPEDTDQRVTGTRLYVFPLDSQYFK